MCIRDSSSGAHFNPALTIALAAIGNFSWSMVPGYVIAQFAGAFVGAVLVYVLFAGQFEVTKDQGTKLGVFCTGPSIANTGLNLLSEIIGTFVLVFAILGIGNVENAGSMGLNYFFVFAIIVSIGMSLGGLTGYAINPARDLGPRLAHAVLPIPGKGDSNFGYAWIPVVGPITVSYTHLDVYKRQLTLEAKEDIVDERHIDRFKHLSHEEDVYKRQIKINIFYKTVRIKSGF